MIKNDFHFLFQIAYFIFLAIFSYMLLVEFSEEMGSCEHIIFIWILTLMIEEMRQVNPLISLFYLISVLINTTFITCIYNT